MAHALIIAIAKLNNDPNYESYCPGNSIHLVVRQLLEMVGIYPTNGAGIPELTIFQEHFHDYKTVVYDGLKCDSIMFEGQVESSKRLHVLYDVTRH